MPGEVWVRGDQFAGEYAGPGSTLDPDGWFHTNGEGWIDEGWIDEGWIDEGWIDEGWIDEDG